MFWNKKADWLPLDNAIAQVKLWETDLQYAKEWLRVMEGMRVNNKAPGFLKQYNLAVDDVANSKKELAKAEIKLEESRRLEKIYS